MCKSLTQYLSVADNTRDAVFVYVSASSERHIIIIIIIIIIYDLLLRYSYNTWEVTNCSNNQFTTVSLWLFLYVRVKHVKVSAVKNKYYIKNTAAAGVGLVRLCIYFVYCTWRSSKV